MVTTNASLRAMLDPVVERLPSEPSHRYAMPRRAPVTLDLIVVLALATMAILHETHEPGRTLELRPDALEYAVVANRIARAESIGVPVGNRVYPSRYPIGFPLLLAPAAAVGVPPHSLWLVSALAALGGVAATYSAAAVVGGRLGAIWAAAMLALAPLYVRYGTMTMSDVPSAAITAVWAMLVLRRPRFFLLGVAAGFACSMRLMNVPLLVVGAVLAAPDAKRRLGFAVGAAVGLVPLAAAWVATGVGPAAAYAFWIPEHYRNPADAFGSVALVGNYRTYAGLAAGLHSGLYTWPVVLLAARGLWSAVRSPRGGEATGLIAAVATAVVNGGIALVYFYRDPRLLLPMLPLALVIAARALRDGVPLLRSAMTIVALTALLLQAHLRLWITPHATSPGSDFVADLVDVGHQLGPRALVVSDVAAPLAWLYWIRGTERTFVPITVPPRSASGPLVDMHLQRLARMRTSESQPVDLPQLYLQDGERLRGESGTIVVLCTAFGKGLPGRVDALHALRHSGRTGECELFRSA